MCCRVSETEAPQMPPIELFLVPGVVFGDSGERMGHGQGYYDKILARYPDTLKCGVAFKEQVFNEDLPIKEHDVKMDALVTQDGVTQFGKKV